MQNGFVESFNGRMRDELLNETMFRNLARARDVIADWPPTTTQSDRIRPWITRPRLATRWPSPPQSTAPLREMKAPRVGRFLNLSKYQPGSGRGWMKAQWQVTQRIVPCASS